MSSPLAVRRTSVVALLAVAILMGASCGADERCADSEVRRGFPGSVWSGYVDTCAELWTAMERVDHSVVICARLAVIRDVGDRRHVCTRRVELITIDDPGEPGLNEEQWSKFEGDQLFCGTASSHVSTADASVVVSVAAKPF